MEWVLWLVEEHLGTSASIVGAWLTVLYARRAKSAADNASHVAQATKDQLASVSVLTLLNDGLRLAGDLNQRVADENWELIEERASSLRLLIASMVKANEELFSADLQPKLIQLTAQMTNLASEADKVRFNGRKPPDQSNIRRLVKDQQEVLLMAIEEVKGRLESNDAVS